MEKGWETAPFNQILAKNKLEYVRVYDYFFCDLIPLFFIVVKSNK